MSERLSEGVRESVGEWVSAYRKKLEEEKQWEYEDRLADKVCVCVCV
jgi:hypothetical protein